MLRELCGNGGENAQKKQEYIKRQLDEDKAGEQLTMENL